MERLLATLFKQFPTRRMKKLIPTLVFAALAGTACISVSAPTPTSSTPFFVTATLAPTRTPAAIGTPDTTGTPGTPGTPLPSGSAVLGCKDAAILVQDVTIADGTNIPYGAKFTKTWQFQNTGTCPWSGYTIAFVSGDRMSAPDSAPVPDTASKGTVNVSIDLAAPTSDGIYTGFYELRNGTGKPLPIGTFKTFWVKITVGAVTMTAPTASTSAAPTTTGSLTTPHGPLSCKYTTSGSYPGEVVNLINQARQGAGLAALNVDASLTASAQNHSIDMACFSLLSHTGSDGSSIAQRIAAAGYPGSNLQEMIYGGTGAYPQTAFTWWMNDPTHHAVIFNTGITDIGVGFAFVSDSAYGDYYTVDVGSQ